MSILFYGKKTKIDCDKLLSIYLRVTIDGKRFEVSTQRYIEPGKWSRVAAKAKGNSEEAKSINTYLDVLKNKVYDYQKLILQEGGNFTRDELYRKWYGIKERTYNLVEVFEHHNDQLHSLIGKDCSKATFGKYRTTLDHTVSFLKWKFQRPDIEISKLNYSFITDFEFWLKSFQNCNQLTFVSGTAG